jgi:putative lipase involved disintegration of autophagic bodies
MQLVPETAARLESWNGVLSFSKLQTKNAYEHHQYAGGPRAWKQLGQRWNDLPRERVGAGDAALGCRR